MEFISLDEALEYARENDLNYRDIYTDDSSGYCYINTGFNDYSENTSVFDLYRTYSKFNLFKSFENNKYIITGEYRGRIEGITNSFNKKYKDKGYYAFVYGNDPIYVSFYGGDCFYE